MEENTRCTVILTEVSLTPVPEVVTLALMEFLLVIRLFKLLCFCFYSDALIINLWLWKVGI